MRGAGGRSASNDHSRAPRSGSVLFRRFANGLTLDPIQDRAQITVQHCIDFAASLPRREDDLLDQYTQSLCRFLTFVGPIQSLSQRRNLLRVDRRGGWQEVGVSSGR